MANVSNPDKPPPNPPPPIKLPTPKRGAFPTPKSEIEKAKPYIPGASEEEDDQEGKSEPPTDVEDEKEGEKGPMPSNPSE